LLSTSTTSASEFITPQLLSQLTDIPCVNNEKTTTLLADDA
jgi:hypothetical protein